MKNNFDFTIGHVAIPKKDNKKFKSILKKHSISDYEVNVIPREFGEFGSIDCIDYCFYEIDFDGSWDKRNTLRASIFEYNAEYIKDITQFISEHPMTEHNDGRTMFFVHDYVTVGDTIGDFWECYDYSLEVQISC